MFGSEALAPEAFTGFVFRKISQVKIAATGIERKRPKIAPPIIEPRKPKTA
jgi:hypothetical protein